jgi:AraC-like DNA-binding protein
MTEGANRLTSRATFSADVGPPMPALQFRAFVDAFGRLGYDTPALLMSCGLQSADLTDPDGLVPYSACGDFFRRACEIRRMANLGVRLAAVTPTGAFPLLDYLALTSDDVGQAFTRVARYFRLANAPLLIDVCEEDEPVALRYLTIDPNDRFSVEYSATLHVLRVQEETDGRARPEFVNLKHVPDDLAGMEAIVQCPVRTSASWAGLAFSREAWRQPLKRPDAVLRSVLEQHADHEMSRLPAADGIPLDVRRAIASRVARGGARLETVARDLAVSPRTLQRRLAAAGSSFDALVDDAAREIAEKQLRESSLSLAEIAYLVGYSEPASFHRAFKRWTGTTPHAFRQAARGDRAG